MPQKTLFVVRSPLQTINAIEAAYSLCSESLNSILICESGEVVNDKQMWEVARLYKWHDIKSIRSPKRWRVLTFLWYICITNRCIYSMVCVGDPTDSVLCGFFQWIATQKQLVYLDDGLSTLEYLRHGPPKDLLLKKVLLQIFALNPSRKNHRFFSAFPSAFVGVHQKILVAENKYSFLKYLQNQTVKKRQAIADYLIIGENIVEDGSIDLVGYVKIMSKIFNCDKLKGRKLYLPHRRENKEKIGQLVQQIGCDVYYPKMSLELEFIDMDMKDVAIVSIQSTVLVTMPRVYDNIRLVIANDLDVLNCYPKLRETVRMKQDFVFSVCQSGIEKLIFKSEEDGIKNES
jgi:hypothetical protein